MSVNLSIKNAPDEMVRRLRRRAVRNHRSLQGELLAIIDEAVGPYQPPLTPAEVLAEVRRIGLSAKKGEAVALVRAERSQH